MDGIRLEGITRRFPGVAAPALNAVDMAVDPGALFVILGPSGSGKTTLLRVVAGLEAADRGAVWFGDRRVDALPPHRRDVGLVFQAPALYPYLDVAANLGFGLRARRVDRATVAGRVAEVADLLGITDLLGRRPAELSGGQRQRVAIGRALARRPAVLLLDEPFAALDPPLRASTRGELVAILRRSGVTTILVTHDQAEALAVADRMAVLDAGRLLQSGAPLELYDRPANVAVARFLGSPPMNLLPAGLVEPAGPAASGCLFGIRPERLRPGDDSAPGSGRLTFHLEVARVEPLGAETIVHGACAGVPVSARWPGRYAVAPGARLAVNLAVGDGVWFDVATGRRVNRAS